MTRPSARFWKLLFELTLTTKKAERTGKPYGRERLEYGKWGEGKGRGGNRINNLNEKVRNEEGNGANEEEVKDVRFLKSVDEENQDGLCLKISPYRTVNPSQ